METSKKQSTQRITTRMISIFISTIMVFIWFAELGLKTHAAGDSAADPIYISTVEELLAIGTDATTMSKHYKLANDITMTEPTYPIGVSENGVLPFTGSFNGGGKILTLNIVSYSINVTEHYAGLFAKLEGASVMNIKLCGVTALDYPTGITNTDSHTGYVGLIAGTAKNSSLSNIVSYNLISKKVAISIEVCGMVYMGALIGVSTNTDISGSQFNTTTIGWYENDALLSLDTATEEELDIFYEYYDARVPTIIAGGFVGEFNGGTMNACQFSTSPVVETFGNIISYGGCIGRMTGGKITGYTVAFTHSIEPYVTKSFDGMYSFGGIIGEIDATSDVLLEHDHAGFLTAEESAYVEPIDTMSIGGIAGSAVSKNGSKIQINFKTTITLQKLSSPKRPTRPTHEFLGVDNVIIGGAVGYVDAENFSIENLAIDTSYIGTSSFVHANKTAIIGGAVGWLKNGTIKNCRMIKTATLSVNTPDATFGGVVGKLENGLVTTSSNPGFKASNFSISSGIGTTLSGGIVGSSINSTISQCLQSADSNIAGEIKNTTISDCNVRTSSISTLGGIVDTVSGGTNTIKNTLFNGQTVNNPIAGTVADGATLTVINSFYNSEKNPQETVYGTGKTLTELGAPATYTGWDTDIWDIVEGKVAKLKFDTAAADATTFSGGGDDSGGGNDDGGDNTGGDNDDGDSGLDYSAVKFTYIKHEASTPFTDAGIDKPIELWINGGKITHEINGAKADKKSINVEIFMNIDGGYYNMSTSKNIVWGATLESTQPDLDRGKFTKKDAVNYLKVSKGKLTSGKSLPAGGDVYVYAYFVKKVGKTTTAEKLGGFKVKLYGAPSSVSIVDSKKALVKAEEFPFNDSSQKLYINPLDKNKAQTDLTLGRLTYSITIDKFTDDFELYAYSISGNAVVSKADSLIFDNTMSYFTVKSTKESDNGKPLKTTITITNLQSGKKTKVSVTSGKEIADVSS